MLVPCRLLFKTKPRSLLIYSPNLKVSLSFSMDSKGKIVASVVELSTAVMKEFQCLSDTIYGCIGLINIGSGLCQS